ncbi:MAG: hypothetical protein JWQ38_1406 [Flavipsychrobacter sp.]|nr:hypothetical protein [Flavipsychrobacter sp.]
MKRNHLLLIVFTILICTVASTDAAAWRRYKYCKKHSCLDGCYKDRHFRPFRSREISDAERDNKNKEMEGKYYHTYKNYERNDGAGYYKYYDNHNHLYVNPGYKDNYRPEVDGNKK